MQNYYDVYNENGFKQSLISSAINSKNQLYNYNSKSDYYQTNYYKKGMIFWNFIDDNLNYNKITDFYNFVKSNILKNEIIDDKDIVNNLKETLNYLVKIINNFNKTLIEEYKISYQRGNVLFNGI